MPTVSLIRCYSIDCAHQLHGLPPNHKCARLHGHTYNIEIEVRATGDLQNGMILDAQYLDVDIKPILNELDHHSLNEFMEQPTAENLGLYLWNRLAFLNASSTAGRFQLERIRIWETAKLAAEVSR